MTNKNLHPRSRNFVLAAAAVLAILLLCPSAQASTIAITGNYSWSYDGILVGPYLATVNNVPGYMVFCMDLHTDTGVNTTYPGSLSTPNTQAEDEAAFLASYSLYLGGPSSDPAIVNKVEGPIALAIWQLMGTLGPTAPDPAAAPYILLAQNAYSAGKIPAAFLNSVSIWTPNPLGAEQRFVTAISDPAMFQGSVPESRTEILLGTGMLMLALMRVVVRRRQSSQ